MPAHRIAIVKERRVNDRILIQSAEYFTGTGQSKMFY
jgi:hypothetical protein